MSQRSAVRGRLLTFTADPAEAGAAASHRYWADGVVAIRALWDVEPPARGVERFLAALERCGIERVRSRSRL